MSVALAAGLEDRAVVVTGVARGIGRAIAEAFAASGVRVCGVDLTQEGADGFLEDVAEPDRHLAVGLDLTEIGAHDALLARADAELGGLAALVHAAGVVSRQDLLEVDEASWDRQTDTNVKATFFLARSTAELLRERGRGGAIVTFSSQGWWTGGFGGSVVYNAGKGAIVTMTRGLARTYGSHGIRVNAIAPGLVETPMLTTGISQEALDKLTEQVPLGRMAQPRDIAGTAVFLASDHAQYVSGATINVSGGFLMY